MKEATRFWTATAAHSARFALESAGIDCVVRGQELGGMLGESFSIRVGDSDLDRARRIIQESQDTPASST